MDEGNPCSGTGVTAGPWRDAGSYSRRASPRATAVTARAIAAGEDAVRDRRRALEEAAPVGRPLLTCDTVKSGTGPHLRFVRHISIVVS
jgi:hypothetical protein